MFQNQRPYQLNAASGSPVTARQIGHCSGRCARPPTSIEPYSLRQLDHGCWSQIHTFPSQITNCGHIFLPIRPRSDSRPPPKFSKWHRLKLSFAPIVQTVFSFATFSWNSPVLGLGGRTSGEFYLAGGSRWSTLRSAARENESYHMNFYLTIFRRALKGSILGGGLFGPPSDFENHPS